MQKKSVSICVINVKYYVTGSNFASFPARMTTYVGE